MNQLALEKAQGPNTEQPQEKRGLIQAVQEYDPDLARRAVGIMAGRKSDEKISPERAIAAALYERETGHREGRDFNVDEKMGLVPRYQGVERDAHERNVGRLNYTYRPLTTAEVEENEVEPGDNATICVIEQLDIMREARLLGVPYTPIVGIGIVKKFEKTNREGKPIYLKGGYTWARKARNRAYKDALRHTPGHSVTATEVLEDAGITPDLQEGAWMSRDQAVIWAENERAARQRAAELEQMSPAERAALLEKSTLMRNPDFDGYE